MAVTRVAVGGRYDGRTDVVKLDHFFLLDASQLSHLILVCR